MKLQDNVYGTFELNEEVLLELIASKPVQRLKGIAQHGLPQETVTAYPYYTRYEHSIGVMLLLRKLGAGLEEQVAGLLHDVSHTAFSHVIDWLLGDPSKEDYQDNMLGDHIRNSDINAILVKHGFDASMISEMEKHGKYTLLERDSPSLCADRVDYTLRDSLYLLKVDVSPCVADLTTKDGAISFKSTKQARAFGNWFMECQNLWWMGDESKLRYILIADMLDLAIKKGIINHEQLYYTDDDLIKAIRTSNNHEVLAKMQLAFGKLNFNVVKSGGIELTGKVRYIDPKVVDEGRPIPLSSIDSAYKAMIKDELEKHAVKVHVQIVS